MTGSVQLGWRVPAETWERFVEHVAEKHAEESVYIRVGIESAMMEFLDQDGILREAEELLQNHTDLRSLSSSTAALATDRYQDDDTRLVTHRIRPDLKEEFKIFADKHNAPSYGRLLAAALDSYSDGGRARRLLEDVKQLISTATSTGSTDESKENLRSSHEEGATNLGSTGAAVETRSSTEGGRATSTGSTPDPMVVAEAVGDIRDGDGKLRMFSESEVNDAIAAAAGTDDANVLEQYRGPVVEQLNAGAHPHQEELYITDEYREELNLWADLDRCERVVLLRRFIVARAIKKEQAKVKLTYREVTTLFEEETQDGPSHQYAYDLMEEAADEQGFEFREFTIGRHTSQKQLRVDVTKVRQAILDWARDERALDPSQISIVTDVTSYSAGPAPQQNTAADD